MRLFQPPGQLELYLAGGYAGFWARANARAEIFEAFMRRQVYATTGPRITLRLFGGWNFGDDVLKQDWVKAGKLNGKVFEVA